MGGSLWVDSPYAPWSFLLVTLALGGSAAFTAGRALAQTWRPMWQAFAYAGALAAAAGFLHYVLFNEAAIPGAVIVGLLRDLPSDPGPSLAGLLAALSRFAVIYVTLCAFAAAGYRTTRAGDMARQYGFETERAGPFSWRQRA